MFKGGWSSRQSGGTALQESIRKVSVVCLLRCLIGWWRGRFEMIQKTEERGIPELACDRSSPKQAAGSTRTRITLGAFMSQQEYSARVVKSTTPNPSDPVSDSPPFLSKPVWREPKPNGRRRCSDRVFGCAKGALRCHRDSVYHSPVPVVLEDPARRDP